MFDMERRLGCKAHELEVGMEFSMDEGRSWYIVQTTPRYLSDAIDCLTLAFKASRGVATSWEEIKLEDFDHVLLERHWKG